MFFDRLVAIGRLVVFFFSTVGSSIINISGAFRVRVGSVGLKRFWKEGAAQPSLKLVKSLPQLKLIRSSLVFAFS